MSLILCPDNWVRYTALDALYPTYLSEESLLKDLHLRYRVQAQHSFQAPEGKMYSRFILSYAGQDGVPGTSDDIIIDTQKVIQQPMDFGLPEVVLVQAEIK